MKIELGDYIICNMGEGNEIVHIKKIDNDNLIGVRFCSINPGSTQFPIWVDPTERQYPTDKCSLFCKGLKKENFGYISDLLILNNLKKNMEHT